MVIAYEANLNEKNFHSMNIRGGFFFGGERKKMLMFVLCSSELTEKCKKFHRAEFFQFLF